MVWIRSKWDLINAHRKEAVVKKRVFSMYCLLPRFDYDNLSIYNYDLGYGKNHYADIFKLEEDKIAIQDISTKVIVNSHQIDLESLG